MENANSIAIAGGAVAVALIDRLVAGRILSASDARGVLTEAQRRLEPFVMNSDAAAAARIVSDLFQGLSENSA